MLVGLMDEGKRCLQLNCEDDGLVITVVLDISKFTSQLLSLPLLQEPSFSFLMLISFESLLFKDNNYSNIFTKRNQCEELSNAKELNPISFGFNILL